MLRIYLQILANARQVLRTSGGEKTSNKPFQNERIVLVAGLDNEAGPTMARLRVLPLLFLGIAFQKLQLSLDLVSLGSGRIDFQKSLPSFNRLVVFL